MNKTDTCTVACLLPGGLQLEFADGSRLTLKGANAQLPPPRIVMRDGRTTYTAPPPMPHSVAPGITTGVPRAAFEAWLQRSADIGPVKNARVFIVEGSVEDAIAAHTGDHFHGLNPDAPPPGIARATG